MALGIISKTKKKNLKLTEHDFSVRINKTSSRAVVKKYFWVTPNIYYEIVMNLQILSPVLEFLRPGACQKFDSLPDFKRGET